MIPSGPALLGSAPRTVERPIWANRWFCWLLFLGNLALVLAFWWASTSSQPMRSAGDPFSLSLPAGAVIPTQFGDVQVRVVVPSGRITNVSALQMPTDRARSYEITQYVTPVLHDEAIRRTAPTSTSFPAPRTRARRTLNPLNDALHQDHMA